MMSDIIIRDAKVEDTQEMAIVRQNVWATTYRGIYNDEIIDDFDYEKAAHSFMEKIERPTTMFKVAVCDKKIVGYVCFGESKYKYKDYPYIINYLHILKNYQGKGLGRLFFNKIMEYVKQNHIDKFYVSCNKYNYPACQYYEKVGGIVDYVDEVKENKKDEQVIYTYSVGGLNND